MRKYALYRVPVLVLRMLRVCFVCRLCSHHLYVVVVVCQITCESSTGPGWWSTRGPSPTWQLTPSHGSRSRWPADRVLRPSCWSVGLHHKRVIPSAALVLVFLLVPFVNQLFVFLRLVQMDQTQWFGRNWEYQQSSGIMTNLLWLLCCTFQRWASPSTRAPLHVVFTTWTLKIFKQVLFDVTAFWIYYGVMHPPRKMLWTNFVCVMNMYAIQCKATKLQFNISFNRMYVLDSPQWTMSHGRGFSHRGPSQCYR